MGIRVGIDLGTTFSAIAYVNENSGKPEIIKNSFGDTIIPSVLCFQEDGKVLFGEDAKGRQLAGDLNSIAFFKRNMGNEMFLVNFFGKGYNATDLSAIFLEKIKQEAEQEIGQKITDAVITVPAYFTHKEREATIEAGRKAGINVLSIINEPTAAAFAYGLNEKQDEQTILIYDLGGGTFDVTIAKIDKDEIEIIGSDGNHELGGKDWDDCIARYIAQELYENHDIDVNEDSEMLSSLLVIAENAKKQLTSRDEVTVQISFKDKKVKVTITEELFENISEFLLGETKDLTNNLIESVGLTWNDIQGAILVGGSTRMRMIHKYVKEMSGKEPLSGINVDEAVALGAAIRANIDENGKVLSKGMLDSSSDESNMYFIAGAKKVSDVTAHALGMISVSVDGDRYVNSRIIEKNSKIPAINTRSFEYRTRQSDNELEVYVLQGDYERPLDNTIINKYVITDIEKTIRSTEIIDVNYKYTSNGVVEVSAIQKETGKSLPIRIESIPEDMSWTDKSPKEEKYIPKVEVILTVDLSGSMAGEPLEEAKKAMKNFVLQMDSQNTKIGVVAFADRSKVMIKPTEHFQEVLEVIDGLSIDEILGYGTSAEPFSLSKYQFEESDIKYIVILTDGVWYNSDIAIKEAKQCHKNSIEVMALGFGTANYDFLKQIASTEEFASLTNLSGLTSSFSKIAQEIGDASKSNSVKII